MAHSIPVMWDPVLKIEFVPFPIAFIIRDEDKFEEYRSLFVKYSKYLHKKFGMVEYS